MTDQPTTYFKYGYPITNVNTDKLGETFMYIDVVNSDAEDRLKEILAEFHGIDITATNIAHLDIEDIHKQPANVMKINITENNIEDIVDMLIDADAVTEEEADEIEPEEIQERIAGLSAEDRDKIFEKLEIKSGRITGIDWEEKPNRFNEKGQLSVGLKADDAQDLIDMINSNAFKPDGTPVFETDERQLDLF